MHAIERREPLRRRILDALAQGPASPGAIAQALDVAAESLSRKLKELTADGLVSSRPDRDDRRRRWYELTPAGEIELGEHRAFGAQEAPPHPPDDATTLAFLRAAIDNAVRLRRERNLLGDAALRLERVLEQAYLVGSPALAVEAIGELTTTLRQDRQVDRLTTLLDELELIAAGQHRLSEPTVALPAIAHRQYELGRLPEPHGGDSIYERAGHLKTAATHYGDLARLSRSGSSARWRQREAWSIVSLAANLREQSEFERAIEETTRAMRIFEELDDPYGRSRCSFMLGFCLRLRGDFDHAWSRLGEAHALASAHAFERFVADCLLQMGDVRRCQAQTEEARTLLDDALVRARKLDLPVIQAFAQSSLGAVEYEEQRYDQARAALSTAEHLLTACKHSEGFALNERRQAVVASRQNPEDLGAVRRFALDARDRYQRLNSPAGVAAMEIELARLERTSRKPPSALRRLIARLDDTPWRNLVELDPWVPWTLADFAAEIGHEGLRMRAGQLLAAARQRLAVPGLDAPGPASGAFTKLDMRSPAGGLARFEMGGETRRSAPENSIRYAI